MWDILIYKVIFTSCPIVRWSSRRSITWAGPLDVPVLVQDVFSCLHLIALSGQRIIWKPPTRHVQVSLRMCFAELWEQTGTDLEGFAPGRCHLSPACPFYEMQLSELKRKDTWLVDWNHFPTHLENKVNNTNLLTATLLFFLCLF